MFRRDEETTRLYKEYLDAHPNECFFCSDKKIIIKDFKYWQISECTFPYNLIAEKHHLLFPKRHFSTYIDFTKEEQDELSEIRQKYIPTTDYDSIIENTPKYQTIPGHTHLHLITYKKDY